MEKINKIIEKIPGLPGVYKMLNKEGDIIYIGKAKNLKKRVSSYFNNSSEKSIKTKKMVSHVESIDFIVVDSELEAIMLETNLIKEVSPKYNILMKDDKNFAYIKIDQKEDFPRIHITRNKVQDGGLYFGPKTSSFVAKETLKLLKKIFPYRHCPLNIEYDIYSKTVKTSGNFKYPCIDYYIKRCQAPCINKISSDDYKKNIKEIADFLSGKTESALTLIKEDMLKAAEQKRFEAAAKIRDRLQLLEKISEQQKISTPQFNDLDVINFATNSKGIHVSVFQIRFGKVINQINYSMKCSDDIYENEEITAAIIQDYYSSAETTANILLPFEPLESDLVKHWLEDRHGGKINFIVPQKGKKTELLELAKKNAVLYADKQLSRFEEQGPSINVDKALEELMSNLNLSKLPNRIECYDISHLGGDFTVASMVVFKKGFPSKKDYRSFKLRTISQGEIDDFKSMNEVLFRRVRHLSLSRAIGKYKASKATKKDLIEIDETTKNWNKPLEKNENDEIFVIKDENKKVIAFIKSSLHHNKYLELIGLWVDKEKRGEKLGYILLHKAINSAKVKKTYIICKDSLKDYYSKFGFQEIYDCPESLKERLEFYKQTKKRPRLVLLYDKNKHLPDSSFSQKPDLIVIDGGKGQLSSACKALEKSGVKIPIISLAKKYEEVFIPDNSNPINIRRDSQSGFLLQRIRDEAHKFAVELNRSQRSKSMLTSSLDGIKGIGENTRKKLIASFGSVENIKLAPLSELKSVVGEKMALKIKASL